jgi:hypothetical protein
VPALATTDADTTAQLRQLQIELGQVQGGVGPTSSSSILGDVGKAIWNVPRSAMGVAEGFANVLMSPIETATTLGRVGEGALDVLLEKDTEEAKLAREAFKQATRLLRDPRGTLVNDPVGALLDIAGLAGGVGLAAKVGGLSRVASAANRVESLTNPIKITTKIVGGGARKLKRAAVSGLGQTAGVGSKTLLALEDAGRAGGKRQEFANELIKGRKDMAEAAQAAARAANEADNLKSMRFEEALGQLEFKNPNNPIRPDAVRLEIFQMMEKAFPGELKVNFKGKDGIELQVQRGSSFAETGELGRLKSMMEVLKGWGKDNTWAGAHRVQIALDKLLENGLGKNMFQDSNHILTSARQSISSELKRKVKGFAEMQARYEEDIAAINEIREALGLKRRRVVSENVSFLATEIPAGFSETALTKLGNALNDRGAKNLGKRQAALDMLDEAAIEKQLRDAGVRIDDSFRVLKEFGDDTPKGRLRHLEDLANQNNVEVVPLREMIAAIRVADEATVGIARARSGQGLIGGGLAGGLAFDTFGGLGLGAAGAAGVALSKWLGQMTLRNPRAVGRFMLGLGAMERPAIKVQQVFEKVAAATPADEIAKGITFGAALERLGDRSKEKVAADKLLGPLGI